MTPRGAKLPKEDMGQDLAVNASHFAFTTQEGNSEGQVGSEGQSTAGASSPVEADFGDLEASPGLYEYLADAEHGVEYLFRLASALQTDGHFQRALLALERVIDSGQATPEQAERAAKGIAALRPTLPPWNVDPMAQISLKIHLGSARPTDDLIRNAVLDLATHIREISGEQIEIVPVITSGSGEQAVPNGPIAIWFTTMSDKPASTAVLSVTPQSNDPEAFLEDFSLTAYRLVRGYLARIGYSTDSPPVGVSGRDLLSNYLTRRMWYDFSQNLLSEEEALSEDSPRPARALPLSEDEAEESDWPDYDHGD